MSTTTRADVRVCTRCGRTYALWGAEVACECGGPLAWTPAESDAAPSAGIWRYARLLPPVAVENRVTLGEGVTPLLDLGRATVKLDFLLPTGAFKDRGSAVLASCARELGVTAGVADSSGNAGASLAAYFAHAGMPLTVFVPAGASSPKVRQAQRYGADVREVDGGREAATSAARAFADETGAFYASHAWSPFFVAGMRTVAAELVEQLGRAPETVVAPVGAGTLVLGLREGFALLGHRPRIVGVQAERCSPLAFALHGGDPDTQTWEKSVAEGINIAHPPRAEQILGAVRENGDILTVTEDEILGAHEQLARTGVFVERTASAAWAGAEQLDRGDTVVILTGSGLKERLD